MCATFWPAVAARWKKPRASIEIQPSSHVASKPFVAVDTDSGWSPATAGSASSQAGWLVHRVSVVAGVVVQTCHGRPWQLGDQKFQKLAVADTTCLPAK